MKGLIVAFTLAAIIAQTFVQTATAAPRNRDYKHEDACMYRGYPCSEWTRDDRW
jgi:hypothetical protein